MDSNKKIKWIDANINLIIDIDPDLTECKKNSKHNSCKHFVNVTYINDKNECVKNTILSKKQIVLIYQRLGKRINHHFL